MDDVKNIHDKIDAVRNEVNDVKIGMAEIKTLLSSHILNEIQDLKQINKENEEAQRWKNRMMATAIFGLVLNYLFELFKTVS